MYDVLTVVFAGITTVAMIFIAVLLGWKSKKETK